MAQTLFVNRRGTEPYARWCERTGEVTPLPTRFCSRLFLIAVSMLNTVNRQWIVKETYTMQPVLAFDVYGTLIDTQGVTVELEDRKSVV